MGDLEQRGGGRAEVHVSPLQRDSKCHGGTENLAGRQKKDHGKSWPDEVTREKTWMKYWIE